MNNHIIVGPGNMCLCGSYSSGAVGCQQIIDSLPRFEILVASKIPGEEHCADLLRLCEALKPLIVDVDGVPASGDFIDSCAHGYVVYALEPDGSLKFIHGALYPSAPTEEDRQMLEAELQLDPSFGVIGRTDLKFHIATAEQVSNLKLLIGRFPS
jgi:hypothetical protein